MPIKVLHLPTNVGGMPWGLAQAEKKLGFDSKVLIHNNNWLNYEYDINLKLNQAGDPLKHRLKLLKTFFEIRSTYDIFHFNYGTSLVSKGSFNHLDLPYYKKKSKLFVTYNGCDARQRNETLSRVNYSACHQENCYGGICLNPKVDQNKKKRITKMTKYVDKIFAVNPDLMWVLPKGAVFLPYVISGFYEIKDESKVCNKNEINILHAPTDRGCKGSEVILAALSKAANKYRNVRVTLVENVPHKKALELYAKADLIVDQLYVGWYGGIAVEAMKMGKPVISFIRDEDLCFIPEQMRKELPIINADANTIEEVIYKCIENRDYLQLKAQQSLEYANKWHDPLYVADIVTKYYEK
jgi:hypothetical protein